MPDPKADEEMGMVGDIIETEALALAKRLSDIIVELPPTKMFQTVAILALAESAGMLLAGLEDAPDGFWQGRAKQFFQKRIDAMLARAPHQRGPEGGENANAS